MQQHGRNILGHPQRKGRTCLERSAEFNENGDNKSHQNKQAVGELRGDRAEGTPSGFTRIHARHRFDVPGLDERTAQRFAELGMTKYCSVAASLKAKIEIEVELLHDAADDGGEGDGGEAD